jgi:ParB-like chromosome segregation protein Spo0J|nr:MAG TPA: chromosome partitioning protein [Caudoviricetes sp.]
MAAGWSVMDALNRNSKAAAEDKPRARFRTKDISIRKMYSNDRNFYSMNGIEKLAQEILTVGLLENMTVMYAPCERGEYRIIAGERRWRALQLLLKKGYEEFEIATCQIKSVAEEHEEMVNIIMANAYRDKTMADLLQEEQQLRKSLQYMKDNGLTLQGYTLDSGRLRDVIASIMQMSGTKIAQIDSINERLIPEFTEQLKEGRLTFSAAYEISGMDQEQQQDMLEKSQESGGLTWKEVKEAKAAAEEPEEPEEAERQEPEQEETTKPGDDYETPHPEGITSICYGCSRYLECNVKTSTCTSCDQYIDKKEAEKTEQQRYDEEQAAIDRETKRKLQEREQEEKMQHLPSDDKKKTIRLSCDAFDRIRNKTQTFLIVKSTEISESSTIIAMEFREGRATGEQMQLRVNHLEDSSTSSALVDGYCVIGIEEA